MISSAWPPHFIKSFVSHSKTRIQLLGIETWVSGRGNKALFRDDCPTNAVIKHPDLCIHVLHDRPTPRCHNVRVWMLQTLNPLCCCMLFIYRSFVVPSSGNAVCRSFVVPPGGEYCSMRCLDKLPLSSSAADFFRSSSTDRTDQPSKQLK